MVKIPDSLHHAINTESPERICVIGTNGDDGFAQLSPRGSIMVFDDEHLALWERAGSRPDGTKMSIYFRCRDALKTVVPGGVVKFFGTTAAYRSGPTYEKVWERLVPTEKNGDPEKKGYAILIKVSRAEDLLKRPLG